MNAALSVRALIIERANSHTTVSVTLMTSQMIDTCWLQKPLCL